MCRPVRCGEAWSPTNTAGSASEPSWISHSCTLPVVPGPVNRSPCPEASRTRPRRNIGALPSRTSKPSRPVSPISQSSKVPRERPVTPMPTPCGLLTRQRRTIGSAPARSSTPTTEAARTTHSSNIGAQPSITIAGESTPAPPSTTSPWTAASEVIVSATPSAAVSTTVPGPSDPTTVTGTAIETSSRYVPGATRIESPAAAAPTAAEIEVYSPVRRRQRVPCTT